MIQYVVTCNKTNSAVRRCDAFLVSSQIVTKVAVVGDQRDAPVLTCAGQVKFLGHHLLRRPSASADDDQSISGIRHANCQSEILVQSVDSWNHQMKYSSYSSLC